MSLLSEIQESILEPKNAIGPALLKLRFLASRLGSTQLEEWVKHESEGYPPNVPIPDYRKMHISYSGTFSGAFGSGISNAPIPSHLIRKIAGDAWTVSEMRDSIAVVDELAKGEGEIGIDASNLILLLQGKIYPSMVCNAVSGVVSRTAMCEIQNIVRNRILELTLELERAVPESKQITLAKPINSAGSAADKVTRIVNQTINGNYTTVTNTGDRAQITLNVSQGDRKAAAAELVRAGIPQKDAAEFVEILASEQGSEKPLGKKAIEWIGKGVGKIADGTWTIGISTATKLLEEVAMKYYGLK